MNPFRFFTQVYLLVLALIFLPVVIAVLPFWWVIAWVLGKSLSRQGSLPCREDLLRGAKALVAMTPPKDNDKPLLLRIDDERG